MTETSTESPDVGPRVTREQVRDISTLRRASDRRMVAGVAAGLSRHFDIDPILIRVVLAVLSLFGGAGVALYVLAWVTIPDERHYDSVMSRALRRDPTRVMIAGISIGAVIAAVTMVGAIGFNAPHPFPIMVVSILAVGAFVLFSRRADHQSGYPPPPAPAPLSDQRFETGGSSPVPHAGAPFLPPPPPRARPPRSHLFALTMAVVAIALGTLWIVDQTGSVDLPFSAYPGVSLAVIAAGLLVGAWYGRSRLLIVAGVLTTALTVGSTLIGPGPYGERIYRPTSSAALPSNYDLGAGHLVVHLENIVDPASLNGRTLEVEARIGQIEIVVPSSMAVVVDAHVSHGEIYGPRSSDVASLEEGGEAVTMTSVGDRANDLTVKVDLQFGQIVVTQFECPVTPASVPGTGLDTVSTVEGTRYAAACN